MSDHRLQDHKSLDGVRNTLSNLTWAKSDLLLINERSRRRERSFALAEDRGFIQPPGIPNSGLCRPEETTCLRGVEAALDVTRPVTEHEPHSINHSERQLLNNQSSPLSNGTWASPETYSISFPITPRFRLHSITPQQITLQISSEQIILAVNYGATENILLRVSMLGIRFRHLRAEPGSLARDSDVSCHPVLQTLSRQIENRLIIVHELFIYNGNYRRDMCKGE